jgi:outer membrane protein OmpA-like peptidoglycan-associated protein
MIKIGLATALALCTTVLLFAQQGLTGEYYSGSNFEKLKHTRTDPKIDFLWNRKAPFKDIDPESFSVRWFGQIKPPKSGTYSFVAKVDDGIRVKVNGVLVIDSWQMNNHVNYDGQIALQANKLYKLEVEYFNALLEGEARLYWRLPGANFQEYQLIESEYFYQPGAVLERPAPKPAPKPAPASVPKPTTPPPPKKVEAPVAKDSLEKYTPQNVLFVKGQSVILPESYAELDRFAAFLLRNPSLQVSVEGHTDINGDAEKNQVLSEERARVVVEYLSEKGVNANRLRSQGFGETRPVNLEKTEAGFAQNRRVVFVVKQD